MAAGVLNITIEQGSTWERRLRFFTKKYITALVDSETTSLVGSTEVEILPGGIGSIDAGNFVMFASHSPQVTYEVVTGVADLSVGGTLTLDKPLQEIVTGNAITVITPMNLTGAVFNSQIRSTADSADIVASIQATLATDPLDGYFDLSLTDEQTSAIPTPDKTDYTKTAKFTFDGELVMNGKVTRSYNGTVLVSPETTRI